MKLDLPRDWRHSHVKKKYHQTLKLIRNISGVTCAKKTTIRESIPASIKSSGMLTDRDDEKADVLSNLFASFFTDEPLGSWEISPPPTTSIDDNLEVTMNDIRKELIRLDTPKSPESDEIHPRVLFELREFILKPL